MCCKIAQRAIAAAPYYLSVRVCITTKKTNAPVRIKSERARRLLLNYFTIIVSQNCCLFSTFCRNSENFRHFVNKAFSRSIRRNAYVRRALIHQRRNCVKGIIITVSSRIDGIHRNTNRIVCRSNHTLPGGFRQTG